MLFMLARTSPKPFGTSLAMVASSLYSPASRGSVSLRSPDPEQPPHIEFNLLSDPADPPRVLQVARLAESLVRSPGVMTSYGDAYLLPAGIAVNQFQRAGFVGALMAAGAQWALDAPPTLRRMLMRSALPGARPLFLGGNAVPLSDQQLLDAVTPMGHPTSSCAMGRRDDPMAVVDSGHAVIGMLNLFVVDASVMPCVPSGNTNLPTLMLAEHGAQCLLRTNHRRH